VPGFAPVHPGEVLGEAISEGLHLTVAETALRFERLGAARAGLLLRLQDEYDLAQARVRLRDQLAAIEPVRAA
jgi:plasmid maintenance system antidote protein VapI